MSPVASKSEDPTPRSSKIVSIDVSTPFGVPLSAFYMRSFAYYTTKHRWPNILRNVIGHLETLDKQKIKGAAETDLRYAIDQILTLIKRIDLNWSLEPFTSKAKDVNFWNAAIREAQRIDVNVCFYNVSWLLAECYLYRRLYAIFEDTKSLQNFDYFTNQKELSYKMALGAIISLSVQFLKTIDVKDKLNETEIHDQFQNLLKIDLWGNKCDLSLTLGFNGATDDLLHIVSEYDDQILINHIHLIWVALKKNDTYNRVIIVTDNSGYELFIDLVFADFLLTFHLCESVHWYVKTIPWFISDATELDFIWMLDTLATSENKDLAKLGQRWKKYVAQNSWILKIEKFWTLPYPFAAMRKKDSALYHQLCEAKLIIFKGDLNYRKLVGDINWNPTTPFNIALQGFSPSNLCALRTIKADLICGLLPGVSEQLSHRCPDWMISGDYAIIQFHDVTNVQYSVRDTV